MASETLPVYCISDFDQSQSSGNHFYINKLSRHLSRHSFVTRPHRHDFFILVYFSQGFGSHIIDFVQYQIKPGALFFLSPGQVHSWTLPEDAEGEIIFFNREFLESYFAAKKMADYPLFKSHNQSIDLDKNTLQKENLLQIIYEIKTEYEHAPPGNNDLLKDYLDILLIRLGRLTHDAESNTFSDSAQWQIRELESLINEYFVNEQSPAYYADKLHLSVKYLNELCRKYLNKTTTQLIQERIILEAKRLLVHEEMSISQIANKLNFSDHSYFNRFFRKLTGQTPGDFRKQF